jgi:uncharacterized protein Yka (UPF0111/DUF47 family)
MFFFPKNEAYFVLLVRLSDQLLEAVQRLASLVRRPDDASHPVDGALTTELLDEVQELLAAKTAAPFDRNEINDVAARIEQAIDMAEEGASCARIFDLSEPDEPGRRLAGLVVRAAEVIREGVRKLKTPEHVPPLIDRVLRPLQEEAEAAYQATNDRLFSGNPDALEVIKRKSVYDSLDALMREMKELGGMLERMAIKEL